jgi:hypothetical protein
LQHVNGRFILLKSEMVPAHRQAVKSSARRPRHEALQGEVNDRNYCGRRPRASSEPTFIDILLDETGSMSSCHGATVNGFNAFIAEQREVGGDCYLTLSKFDSSGIKTPYENLRLESVPELSFFPGSSTNLFDVVGQRTSAVSRTSRDRAVRLSSSSRTAARMRLAPGAAPNRSRNSSLKAISDGVSFLYFGAGHGAKQQALNMGFPENTITVFDTRHMGETMKTVSAKTRAFRAAA